MGQRRAPTRSVQRCLRAQAETAAALGRVTEAEVGQLASAREATVAELQRLRVCVRAHAQFLFEARNRARTHARGLAYPGGAMASLLNLEPGQLSDIMAAAAPNGAFTTPLRA